MRELGYCILFEENIRQLDKLSAPEGQYQTQLVSLQIPTNFVPYPIPIFEVSNFLSEVSKNTTNNCGFFKGLFTYDVCNQKLGHFLIFRNYCFLTKGCGLVFLSISEGGGVKSSPVMELIY